MRDYVVLYHEKGILIVNKPSGLPSQPTRDKKPNLFEQLQQDYPHIYLHHRLDTPVSGLLLFCTQKRWNKAIASDFQHKRIHRRYWAACLGHPPSKGIWSRPIQGKKAITHFHTEYYGEGWAVLSLTLETGRTHQIRKHAMRAGYPILGDRRYGGAASRLCSRIALHAYNLSFTHPGTLKKISVSAPLPQDLDLYQPPHK